MSKGVIYYVKPLVVNGYKIKLSEDKIIIYENDSEISEEGVSILMYYLFSEGFIKDDDKEFTVEVIS